MNRLAVDPVRPPYLAGLIARRPLWVLGATLALTALALVPALRFRLETDLASLFPAGAPAAAEYRSFLDTFGGFEKVFVVVKTASGAAADPEQLVGAAEQLATALGESREVADVRWGFTPEDEAFFLQWVAPRAPLVLTGDWRRELGRRLAPASIRAQVAALKQTLRGPGGSFAAPLFAADPLGLAEPLLAGIGELPVDPLTGAFLSRDGDAVLLIVTPARAEMDPEGGRRLIAALTRAYAEVRRQSDLPLEFRALGGPIYAADDEAILRHDLELVTASSMIGVALILLIGFEGLLIPLALSAAVLAGTLWTAALTEVSLGRITVVGISFIAALFGMGVEYGIHGGARFRQLRLEGAGAADALAGAFRDTGPGIVSSAMTTAVALAALAVAHFRPLREMGEVLAVGVLAILVTTVGVMAPLLVLFPGATVRRPGASLWRRFWTPLFEGLSGFAARRPWWVLGAALLLTAVAAWGLPGLSLDADMRALRPRDAPASAAEELVIKKFDLGLDTATVVVRAKDLATALDEAARARQVLAAALGSAVDVTSPSDWMVAGSRLEARLQELRTLPLAAAADALERELTAAGFRVDRFARPLAALRAMARGEDPGAPPPGQWPSWMAELVRVAPDGTAAVALHVRAPLGRWPEGPPAAVIRQLKAISPGVAIASVSRVGAELRDLALLDLRRSSAIAGLLVALVVVVSLRGRIGASLLASLPLALGCLWTFGLWAVAGRDVDLLSIATLPVLFGTGIDLGVQAVHGARGNPRGLRGAVAESGLAMTLVVLTTGAGFGSLGTSRVPGLQNAGLLVAYGVAACLLATLFVLPALEALHSGRAGRRRQAGGAMLEPAPPEEHA